VLFSVNMERQMWGWRSKAEVLVLVPVSESRSGMQ
jgi:hypothetical protein